MVPLYEPPDYGVWPLVIGTFTVMLIAVIIAVPGGLAVAFFLSEYASPKVKRFLKPLLEILAGVPTVVFGFCPQFHRAECCAEDLGV